jgi:hypothetical protein
LQRPRTGEALGDPTHRAVPVFPSNKRGESRAVGISASADLPLWTHFHFPQGGGETCASGGNIVSPCFLVNPSAVKGVLFGFLCFARLVQSSFKHTGQPELETGSGELRFVLNGFFPVCFLVLHHPSAAASPLALPGSDKRLGGPIRPRNCRFHFVLFLRPLWCLFNTIFRAGP